MARLPTALLGRPLAPAGAGRARRAGGGGVRRATGAGARAHAGARRGALHSVLTTPLSLAGAGVAFVWMRRRLRLLSLLALCLPALAVGGWMVLRGSSLSAVEKVQISGVRGRQAAQIEAALRRTALGMSTMQVKLGALRAAVAQFPIVREVRVSASFPHGLRIAVIERPPVAVLSAGSERTAVAADGVVLGPELISGTLPSVRVSGVAPLTGHSVGGKTTRAELSILGAAPQTLLGWVQSIASGSEGIVASMRGGVDIYFGDATRPHAKWLAAARVLADSGAAGATYVDVRVPARPVAGTTAPGGLSGASATSSGTSATSLAARLDEAVAGGSAAAAAAAATSPAATSPAGERASSGGESSTSGAGESSTSGTGEASSGGAESTEAAAGGSSGAAATGESRGGASAGETAPGGAAGTAGSPGGPAASAGAAGGATGETAGATGAAATSGGAAAAGG